MDLAEKARGSLAIAPGRAARFRKNGIRDGRCSSSIAAKVFGRFSIAAEHRLDILRYSVWRLYLISHCNLLHLIERTAALRHGQAARRHRSRRYGPIRKLKVKCANAHALTACIALITHLSRVFSVCGSSLTVSADGILLIENFRYGQPICQIGDRLADHVCNRERPVRCLPAAAADRGRLRNSPALAGLSVTCFRCPTC